MRDGYQMIWAFIQVDDKELRVVTESPLDESFSDIGIVVDKNASVKVESVLNRKEARFEKAYPELLEQFKRGTKVVAKLRFWPTWPATKTQTARFSLIGFTKAYDEMVTCLQNTDD